MTPGNVPFSVKIVAKVLGADLFRACGRSNQWTGRAMAAPLTFRRRRPVPWERALSQPDRLCTFKRSNNPKFAEKVEDVVGLYTPAQVTVVSFDEKSQIQALDRTQPNLPLKPGKCGTMTHGYRRNGSRFLNAAARAVPAGKAIPAILGNYDTDHTR
jgi:hypothetical protein